MLHNGSANHLQSLREGRIHVGYRAKIKILEDKQEQTWHGYSDSGGAVGTDSDRVCVCVCVRHTEHGARR